MEGLVSELPSLIALLRSREMSGCSFSNRAAKYIHNHEAYNAVLSALAEDCLVLPSVKAPEEVGGSSSSRRRRSPSDSLDTPYDCLNSDDVKSTIAIAFSPDGKTFATTHGDHTIKIFNYDNGKQIREFKGHERTPWTVKYHPTDSDIVASGCLGFDVRVWDIRRGVLLNKITFENSIISLAFHPSGQYIALASGPHLHTWAWREGMDCKYGGLPLGPPSTKQVLHTRNIRAVAFHPSGEYILAAAPDPPRQQESFTPCRLYAFPFSTILQFSESERTDGAPPTVELWNLPTLIPQIHLYSDGGLDISQDGKFLVTCAILSSPPAYSEDVWLPPGRLPRPQELVDLPSAVSIVSDESNSDLLLPFPLNIGSLDHKHEDPTNPCCTAPGGPNDRFEELFQQLKRLGSVNNDAESDDVSLRVSSGDGHSNKNRRVSRNLLRAAQRNLMDLVEQQAHDDLPTPPRSSLLADSPVDADARRGAGLPTSSTVFADQREVPPSWISTGSLSVIRLNFGNGVMVQPSLVRWRGLSSKLMKAVTSVKFSPSGRYALVGYGVRKDGFVEDHPERTVACELLSVCEECLSSVNMVSDKEDVVNIAQFHPVPGRGLLYGTKSGKVRIFCRK